MSVKPMQFHADAMNSSSHPSASRGLIFPFISSSAGKNLPRTSFGTFVRTVAPVPKPTIQVSTSDMSNSNVLGTKRSTQGSPVIHRRDQKRFRGNKPGMAQSDTRCPSNSRLNLEKELPPDPPSDKTRPHADSLKVTVEAHELDAAVDDAIERAYPQTSRSKKSVLKDGGNSATGSICVCLDGSVAINQFHMSSSGSNEPLQLEPRTYRPAESDKARESAQADATSALFELPGSGCSSQYSELDDQVAITDPGPIKPETKTYNRRQSEIDRLESEIYLACGVDPPLPIEVDEEPDVTDILNPMPSQRTPLLPPTEPRDRTHAADDYETLSSQTRAKAKLGIDEDTMYNDWKQKQRKCPFKNRIPSRENRRLQRSSTVSTTTHLVPLLDEDDATAKGSEEDYAKPWRQLISEDYHEALKRKQRTPETTVSRRHSAASLVSEPRSAPCFVRTWTNDTNKPNPPSADKLAPIYEVAQSRQVEVPDSRNSWLVSSSEKELVGRSLPKWLQTALTESSGTAAPVAGSSNNPNGARLLANALHRAKAGVNEGVKEARHFLARAATTHLSSPDSMHSSNPGPARAHPRRDLGLWLQSGENRRDVLKSNIRICKEERVQANCA